MARRRPGAPSRSPEICVEILSPGNTQEEIQEKIRLYVDAGARELWICSESGKLQFFNETLAELGTSQLCPEFPKKIELR